MPDASAVAQALPRFYNASKKARPERHAYFSIDTVNYRNFKNYDLQFHNGTSTIIGKMA